MVDGDELRDEDFLALLELVQCDVGIVETTIGEDFVRETFHHLANALAGKVLEGAGGSFDLVGYHDDGLLLGHWVGSGIGEEIVIGLLIGMFVAPLDVEIFHL